MSGQTRGLGLLGRLASIGPTRGLAQLRDWLSLIQALLAITAVGLAGSASGWALIATLLLVTWAMLRPLPEALSPSMSRVWTLVIVVALALSAMRTFMLGEELLVAGVDFLLLMVVQRLFNRQRSREHMQLLMLGAVLMVIAAVIDAELRFPILLLLYLPTATLGLLLNHLLSEGERLGRRVQFEVDRYGTRELPRLSRAAVQVASIAALAGVATFLLFPRFGVGVFLRGNLYGRESVGFSERVQLGGFGTIKTDATVVMHLVALDLPDDVSPTQPRLTWHLRGSAFDRYENGSWGHSGDAVEGILEPSRGYWVVGDPPLSGEGPGTPVAEVVRPPYRFGNDSGPALAVRPKRGFADATETVRMLVTMEDIGTDLLFAYGRPLAFSLTPRGSIEARNKIAVDVDEQIRVLDRQPGPIQYEFIGRVGEPSRAELAAIGDPEVPDTLDAYLQLPERRSNELHELAVEITEGAQTRLDKVEAVQQYLLDNYEYSLDQPLSERVSSGELDPVEGFLFDTKAGHCEYFASAMALLLREVGVPTRNVNGFYGAHYNQIGEFWAVRQADAHSWVEVHFGELGWITFDPTPPGGRTAGDDAPWFPGLANLADALRNAYLEYVIDYDLGDQLELLERVGVERSGRRLEIDWRRFAWVPGMIALALAIRWLRRNRKQARAPEVAIYEKLLRTLQRRGRGKRDSESALRWAERLRDEQAPEAGALLEFACKYESLRFGPQAIDPRELDELRSLAAVVLATRP